MPPVQVLPDRSRLTRQAVACHWCIESKPAVVSAKVLEWSVTWSISSGPASRAANQAAFLTGPVVRLIAARELGITARQPSTGLAGLTGLRPPSVRHRPGDLDHLTGARHPAFRRRTLDRRARPAKSRVGEDPDCSISCAISGFSARNCFELLRPCPRQVSPWERTGLLDRVMFHAEVDRAALAGNSGAVFDVELRLLERRRHLVLDHLREPGWRPLQSRP